MALTFRSRALRSVAFIGLAAALAPQAYAQETEAETDNPATLQSEAEIESGENAETTTTADQGDITITGSRIRRPNLESTVPITSIGGEEFFQTGTTAIGDVLNELPALRSTFSQSNSTLSLGTAGLNLLDLRGLGTQRTLVLQNGRRHVGADILNFAASVDVNQIPTDLIERVDIVTGGNSAIYGSDAIAGVVNFVLKRDFEGLQVRGQAGISDQGDVGNRYISVLAGKNFAGGRGNIAINAEYSNQDQYFGGNRDLYRVPRGFITVDTDPASAVNGSDGNPDRVFYENTRSAAFSDAGHFLACCTTGPAPGAYYIPYIFEPNGTLIPQTGTRVGIGPFGSFLNANRGSTFRDRGQLQLLPKIERITANLIGHFKISDALEPFVEAKYVRTKSRGTGFSGPAFMQLGSTFGSPRERFFTDNPFLTDQAEGVIRGSLGDYYTDFDGDRTPDYYEGEYTGPNGIDDIDEFGFTILKNLIDLGVREEKAKRETYRIVAGLRGTFNDDWSYEVSANYGRFDEDTFVGGNLNVQRFLLAIDAVRAPNGNVVCRSTLDPAARVALESAGDPAFAQSLLAGDVAACVPINLFGEGNVTEAARNYVLSDTNSKGRISQFVLNAFVSGDTSSFLNLPGGPVGFALGAEYRREKNFFRADPLVEAGITFYNALRTFDPPSFEVKEAFGEIRLPILADTPFFHQLTVTAAGRVADYKGRTGTVFAYNVGAEWAPVRDLRLRGNFSRAVRAPNLTELYATLGQNFAPGFTDPCSLQNIGNGTPTREANCRAAGVAPSFDFTYAQSLEFRSGGNPDLSEETSDSFTVGGVFQPRFLPGFSLSADYYDITVDDVITSPSAQQIIDACYDAESIENQFCGLFQRAGAGGGPRGEIPGRIIEGSLRAVPLNYAALKVRGLDIEAAYRRQIGNLGRLNARVNYTRVFQNDAFLDPQDPDQANQILFELGDPRDAVNFNADFKTGPFSFGYQLRYIGKMIAAAGQYEDYFSKQGRPPQNADYAEVVFNPAVFYHDFRLGIDVGKKFEFYMGVDNAFNRLPPFASQGIGSGSAIYNNIGRFFYAGAVAKF
jgi:outer membrane receptor protein involved in Fe transport